MASDHGLEAERAINPLALSSTSGPANDNRRDTDGVAVSRSRAGRTTGLRLPDFLIIGAMKAGSTSLARYFMAHPDVFMASGKEVHYFDRHFDKGPRWYAEHFGDVPTNRVAGEATPNYLYLRKAIERMAATVPKAKLVAILRNPVDRAYSHYWHERARGRESLGFEQAIRAEPERLKSSDIEVRMHFSYLDQGRYIEQLQYLAEHFPRDRVLVLLFDDLLRAPVATYKSVCKFIDVGDQYVPKNVGEKYNEFVSFRSLRVRSLAHALPSRPIGLRLLSRVLGRLNTRHVRYPAIDRRSRAKLFEYYKESNRALSSWLGRDLSVWDGGGEG